MNQFGTAETHKTVRKSSLSWTHCVDGEFLLFIRISSAGNYVLAGKMFLLVKSRKLRKLWSALR
jgi:hypothetical protein